MRPDARPCRARAASSPSVVVSDGCIAGLRSEGGSRSPDPMVGIGQIQCPGTRDISVFTSRGVRGFRVTGSGARDPANRYVTEIPARGIGTTARRKSVRVASRKILSGRSAAHALVSCFAPVASRKFGASGTAIPGRGTASCPDRARTTFLPATAGVRESRIAAGSPSYRRARGGIRARRVARARQPQTAPCRCWVTRPGPGRGRPRPGAEIPARLNFRDVTLEPPCATGQRRHGSHNEFP